LLQEFSSKQLIEVDALNKEVSKQGNRSFFVNILLTLILIFFGIFVFVYISNSLMNPIGKLLRMSNKISEGDFSSRIELSATEEFNELALSMNTMSEKIELLIEKSIEEEKQLQMLEYKAHQAQISPHFLYNTLDAIIWAAEAKEIPKVITLVTSLSSFFRISLSRGTDFISISDEIEHVRNYLAIQQIRYSDVLSYEINVDDGLGDQKILKLLLQPLVENSLYHGIKGTRERGKITVNVTKLEGKVRFSVADNGIGLAGERLEALKNEINSEINAEKGYGLFSINRRLKLYYNHSEGVEIKSEYRKGTEVSFVLDLDKIKVRNGVEDV
jgi:two-component system sensor histidine kinase YesM